MLTTDPLYVKYVDPELAVSHYTPKGHCFLCSASDSPQGCMCRFCNQCERWWIAKDRSTQPEQDCVQCKVNRQEVAAA